MIDFIKEYLSVYMPIIIHALIRGLVIFTISLSFVYLIGRMLEITKTDRVKNLMAFFIMLLTSFWSIKIYDTSIIINEYEIYWRTIVYTAIAIIFYVLAGFNLYDRFNLFLDKKIGQLKNKRKKKNENRRLIK